MHEGNQAVYAGNASLEEIHALSFGSQPPIKLEVNDGGKDYSLVFCYGSKKTPRAVERQHNIAELVRAYSQGARIWITGLILEDHGLETVLKEGDTPVDKSIYFGLITLHYKRGKQKYTYYQDWNDPSNIENTALCRGDFLIPLIKERWRSSLRRLLGFRD